MFAYQTCSELIIGCKSFHPLIRLVREKHFKKIVIIYEQTHHGIVPAGVRRLVRQLESKTNQCILAPVDIRLELVKLDTAVDLVISYGARHVHDIAKRSNVFGATIYCIETTPGHMSSYGTGIVWEHNQTAWKAITPQVIFNACQKASPWDIWDFLYFLHDIPLALEAVFNVAKQNDFIITCAFGGILQILKLYQQAKATRNRCKLKKIRCALAQADVLTKNAYNNAPLSMEVKEIAQAIQHYRQFEVVTALESLDMVNNQIRRHGMEIETILHCLGTNLVSFQKDFELMYNDFLNEPKRWEVSSDILGKKLTEIVGRNQQTRRLM